MLRFSSLVLFSFLCFNTLAGDWTARHLSKLYLEDQVKCLEVAERYIEYFPKKSAPYFYAASVYYNNSALEVNPKRRYFKMRKALVYAYQFEQINDTSYMSEVKWIDEIPKYEKLTYEIASNLDDSDLSILGGRLITKLHRLNHFQQEVTATEFLSEDKELVRPEDQMKGQFYGMPTGNELISSYSQEHEQAVLKLINTERIKQGMEPFVWEEGLAQAARYHAYDMGTQHYFDHASYDRNASNQLIRTGGTFVRIRSFYNETFVNSENIAGGNESPKATYRQWFNSKGHYENMFNPESKRVGIGVVYTEDSPYGYYWVMCTSM